jgi:CRISPR-associated endonuclease/helicase Cas3
VLYESQIQSLIDTVYGDGYNDKEQKEFDTARRVFSELDIVPFKEDDSGRDEFEGLFKSIEVVPSKYEEEFMNRLMAKEFYEAMAYITSISERQFARLFKEGQLYKQERQWFIKANYDPERGLLLDELGGNIL